MLEALKEKTSTMDNFRCHGGLLFEDIKLSEHFSVGQSGKLRGFVDLGLFTPPQDSNLPCDCGMVVMFLPFTGEFSQIIGTFATHGDVKGSLLGKILIKAVIVVEKARLFVAFVTCDGASWNRRMWTIMSIQGTAINVTCKVKHPADSKRSLHFLSDFPHLLECLRNSLPKGGFNTPDRRVPTYFVREAYNYDKDWKQCPGWPTAILDQIVLRRWECPLRFSC